MKIGLFGSGRVGRLHARNIAEHSHAELGAVYDVDTAASQNVVDQFGGKLARSAEEIWAMPDIDAVLIASSTNTHVDLLYGAVHSGKAAYCEKPIDLDLEKSKRFAVIAEASDVPIFVGFRRRFLAELQAVHDRLRSGSIGRIEMIQMMARDAQPPPIDYVKVSGGFLRDKAIHYFDLLCWLTDDAPVEVHAVGSCLVDDSIGIVGDVDTVMVTLRMTDGALCQIANGRRSSFGVHESIEVYGADGRLRWDPGARSAVMSATDGGVLHIPPKSTDIYFGQESFAAALDSFVRAVKSGEAMSPSIGDGIRAQIIADAATASLQSNRPIAISY
ncbi:MAG: Gfo/Idh/MocA family oxidoreductase [Hyphomicrobiales bacterium]|nr:Gfo/Idh/MocA family oxidoreductase [Hyphomicrobiales bacterium]